MYDTSKNTGAILNEGEGSLGATNAGEQLTETTGEITRKTYTPTIMGEIK